MLLLKVISNGIDVIGYIEHCWAISSFYATTDSDSTIIALYTSQIRGCRTCGISNLLINAIRLQQISEVTRKTSFGITLDKPVNGNVSNARSFSSPPRYTRVAEIVGMDMPSPKNIMTFLATSVTNGIA